MLSYSTDEIVRDLGMQALSAYKTKQVPSLKSFAYWKLLHVKGVTEWRRLLQANNISLDVM